MKKLIFAALVLIFLPLGVAYAVKVTSLYEADMPLMSQNDDEKAQAIKQAFLQVLIKMTGDPHIADNPEIKPALSRADYYVKDVTFSQPTTNSYSYLVHIRFEKNDIDRLLKRSNVAYWGETRPLILMWLVVTYPNGSSEIIGSDTSGNTYGMIKQESSKYGLPLIFPMMDVDDMNQVSVADVTSKVLPILKEAGKRYAPNGYLIGKIQAKNDVFTSDWQLVLDNSQWNWAATDKSMENIVGTVLNEMSQTLAKRYAIKASDTANLWISLEVSNILEQEDMTRLVNYLQQLAPVRQVKISQVMGDTAKMHVLVNGTISTFEENASIGQHLLLKSGDTGKGVLTYQWVR